MATFDFTMRLPERHSRRDHLYPASSFIFSEQFCVANAFSNVYSNGAYSLR